MFEGIAALAVTEMQEKSKARIYRTDPESWMSDVLGVNIVTGKQIGRAHV